MHFVIELSQYLPETAVSVYVSDRKENVKNILSKLFIRNKKS